MPVTHYVALPFIRANDAIAAGQGQECPNEPSAIHKAGLVGWDRDAGDIARGGDLRTADFPRQQLRECWSR